MNSNREKEFGTVETFDMSQWCVVYIHKDWSNQVNVMTGLSSEMDANRAAISRTDSGHVVLYVIPVTLLLGSICKRRERDKNASEVVRLRAVIDNAKRLAKEKCNGQLFMALDGEFS